MRFRVNQALVVDLFANIYILKFIGEVSERPKEHDWKSCTPGNRGRGFKSRPLRYTPRFYSSKIAGTSFVMISKTESSRYKSYRIHALLCI